MKKLIIDLNFSKKDYTALCHSLSQQKTGGILFYKIQFDLLAVNN